MKSKKFHSEKVLNSTLEEIENDYWQLTDFPSSLVEDIYNIRKKRICELKNDDLRVAITQNVGHEILIPIVIEKLEIDILTEGSYYPGDLLLSLLEAKEYWDVSPKEKADFVKLLKKEKETILASSRISEDIKDELLNMISYYLA
jgi:hypothetical protein